jgi:hypothetical protein
VTSFQEEYTSLKHFYRELMFPKNPNARKWTLAEIDQLDVHFFFELLETIDEQPKEKDVYLSDIW